ncbi:MAG TPA: 2-dehydropantoate 2-reductase [Gaiellaceae bacterium]|nr:2-dehydropantoate 2-reductase [Gaiellaceae bacterium]
MNRTVAVLGPGAVGGALAARLSLAGIRTICVAPPETIGLIALAGIVVETRDDTLTARVEVRERLEDEVGLVLVTVTAPSLEEAIERVDPAAVAEGVVLPLVNGIEHMQALRARFDGRVAAGTISHFQAYRVGRVQIVQSTSSPVITIASDSLAVRELERVAELLREARLDVRVGQSEKRVLWSKAVRIAAIAAATTATGRTVAELRSDPVWRERLLQALTEACEIAKADGVLLQVPAQWEIVEEIADETTVAAARDVVGRRRAELDAIVGSVLRAAERLGVPCPTLTELAATAGLR